MSCRAVKCEEQKKQTHGLYQNSTHYVCFSVSVDLWSGMQSTYVSLRDKIKYHLLSRDDEIYSNVEFLHGWIVKHFQLLEGKDICSCLVANLIDFWNKQQKNSGRK